MGSFPAEVNAQAPATISAPELDAHLIIDFVSWIDRSPKTTRSYLTNLRQFVAWLRYAAITAPVRADIIAYKEWLTAEHDAIVLAPAAPAGWSYRTDKRGNPVKVVCKPSTIAQYLRSVAQFFRWTAAAGLYPDIAANIHAPTIRRDMHRKESLQPVAVLQIEQSILQRAEERAQEAQEANKDRHGRVQRTEEQSKRLLALYLLAVNAGLRTVELSRANIRDLETKDGVTRLNVWGKGHYEPDTVKPLAPEVAAAIRDYLNTRTDAPTGGSPLFVATGNRAGGKRLAPTTISTMLKRAMQDAGYNSSRLTAHSLRHTAGNNVRRITGNNIYETQRYMRHSNPATTEIYMHDDEEDEAREAAIAQQLYSHYHTGAADPRQQLADLLPRLTPQQLQQLKGIAEAMT